jgi:hypothetical protein
MILKSRRLHPSWANHPLAAFNDIIFFLLNI